MAIATIDALNLSREEIIYTDQTTFAGDTLIGKVAAGLDPVSGRTGEECRWIFRVNANGTMTRPIMLATDAAIIPRLNTIPAEDFNLYYQFPQVWDNRAAYTYA